MNGKDILHVADSVAREKGIEKAEVIEAIEVAIQKAARSKYGFEKDIRAKMDPETGEIDLTRCMEVVEEVLDEYTQITEKDAQYHTKGSKVGDILQDPLPPIDFGRVAAQTARQVITQRVREAERQHQFNEYKDRKGEVITGIVRRVEYGNLFIDLGRTEGILRRDEIIPREHLRNGDRVKAYIMDVRPESRGPQVFLSRTHPNFMIELFKQEVPEIESGVIQIVSAARDPGSRAKIAVTTSDPTIDPVGSCVGMRGARVQAVVNELQGEKIDIIPWSENPATFIVNSLIPAEVTKVIIDEETNRVDVVVPDDQLSQAIGRRGQNVRLATQLTGFGIDIMTDTEESDKRNNEMKLRTELFSKNLDVDDMIAQLLATEGFTSIEDIAYVPLDELVGIEGFDEDVASELQSRALDFLSKKDKEQTDEYKKLGVEEALASLNGLTSIMLVKLGAKGIRTRDNLADLSGDELLDILESKSLTLEAANEIIMTARSHWFEEETDKKTTKKKK